MTRTGMSSIFQRLAEKQVVLPYLENAFHSDEWPDSYTITVDSSPYYGLADEEGVTHDTGAGDGYFHPSSHSSMGARELYYRFHPEHAKNVLSERRTLTSHLTLAAGTAMHAVIQNQLNMTGILKRGSEEWEQMRPGVRGRYVPNNLGEWEYINEDRKCRGRSDGILDIPDMGDILFEFKALDVATPILTGAGWSTMGDLVDGDEVYAPDGQLTKVVVAHPIRYDRPCYKVKTRDGQWVVADAEHLWQVRELGVEKVVTTQYLVDKGMRHPNGFRFTVPVTEPLQAPDADLSIDPWLLGAWLGDGTANETALTVGDRDVDYVVGRLRALGLKYHRTRDRNCWRLYIRDLRRYFVRAGLLGNKHIPIEYMMASETQRRSLLAGIMDTDGGVSDHQVSIGQRNKLLALQVMQLARSLGYRVTYSEHPSSLKGKVTGAHHWVKFSSKSGVSPFEMPRKVHAFDKCGEARQKLRENAIVSVDPVPSRPTRCITVAHESSLYVVGEGFLPTHNTMNSRSFRFLDCPKDEWENQTNLGMDHYGVDEARVVVLEMGYPFALKEFKVLRRSAILEPIYERWEYVRECIKRDTPPPCEHALATAAARSCPVGNLCWRTEEGLVR